MSVCLHDFTSFCLHVRISRIVNFSMGKQTEQCMDMIEQILPVVRNFFNGIMFTARLRQRGKNKGGGVVGLMCGVSFDDFRFV